MYLSHTACDSLLIGILTVLSIEPSAFSISYEESVTPNICFNCLTAKGLSPAKVPLITLSKT